MVWCCAELIQRKISVDQMMKGPCVYVKREGESVHVFKESTEQKRRRFEVKEMKIGRKAYFRIRRILVY